MTFNEYVDELERKRDKQKEQALNLELARRLREYSREEVMEKLFDCFSYGVTGDLLTPARA